MKAFTIILTLSLFSCKKDEKREIIINTNVVQGGMIVIEVKDLSNQTNQTKSFRDSETWIVNIEGDAKRFEIKYYMPQEFYNHCGLQVIVKNKQVIYDPDIQHGKIYTQIIDL